MSKGFEGLFDGVQLPGGKFWLLNKDMIYSEGDLRIKIPAGFQTDGFSFPRFLWGILGHPMGRYARAAILHDFLYAQGLYTRAHSDYLFLCAMESLGATLARRMLIYIGCRLFSWIAWIKHRRKEQCVDIIPSTY